MSGNYKHGLVHSPEFKSWSHMRGRCTNSRNPKYKNYGGRGIKVDPRWASSFTEFYADMGPKPERSYSLERIDNDGDYTPDNCKWAPAREQQNNRRDNRRLSLYGETHTVAEWARRLSMVPQTILSRLHYGWTEEMALTIPIRKSRKRS